MNKVDPPASVTESRARTTAETFTILMVIVACIVMILWSAPAFYQRVLNPSAAAGESKPFETIESVVVDLATAPVMGAATAKIGIAIFSDFECPFCRVFALDIFPSLKKRYIDSGEIRLAFKHFPLTAIHSNARRAAELSACLRDHETFWRAHDLLFQSTGLLPGITSASLGRSLGVDPEALETCAANEGKQIVSSDTKQGEALGIPGTPTFLIGEIEGTRLRALRRLSGAKPLLAFESALSSLTGDRR